MIKLKKRKGAWIVYRKRDQVFKCFNYETALFYRNLLKRAK